MIKDTFEILSGDDLDENAEEDDDGYPSYGTPGNILVEIITVFTPEEIKKHNHVYRYESNVIDFDADSSVFYIQEGTGFEYFLDDCDFPEPGFYVIEDVIGPYYKGEWGFEEWEIGEIRKATPEEIEAGTFV